MSHLTSPLRRRLLQSAALGVTGLAAYSYYRGLRFPTLTWEPSPLQTQAQNDQASWSFQDCFVLQAQEQQLAFRAFSPNPRFEVLAKRDGIIRLRVNNICPKAQKVILSGSHVKIQERMDGITRILEIPAKQGQRVIFTYELPYHNDFTFAVIGDTGGHHELYWCIQRAKELGAKFFLHLGDFNYQEGDYARSIKYFQQAPLPCYVAIGNHDFHDEGNIFPQFLHNIGPLNHSFIIGQTRFVNLDTAASFFPQNAGQRGRLLTWMAERKTPIADSVAFTHRPLYNPFTENADDHALGSRAEREYLLQGLHQAHIPTLLAGHLHHSHLSTFGGIQQIIAGQGLAGEDLVHGKNASSIVLGKVAKDGKVDYQFMPLAMPMQWHCHPRLNAIKQELWKSGKNPALRDLEKKCASVDV